MKVGIIGNGFVGRSIYKTFSLMAEMYVYDIDPNKSGCSKEDIRGCDVIFICVPTPMGENGECDLSAVNNTLEWIRSTHFQDIIIKSTIPPKTTDILSTTYDLDLIFSPEFLTERNAENDAINQDYVILGGETIHHVDKLYKERFGKHFNIIKTSSLAAEMVKYMRNSFFALKVIFANEFSWLSYSVGIDYADVKSMFQLSNMVAPFHLDVPGHDGKPGYGGKCFPKDVSAIIRTGEKIGSDMKLMKAVRDINNKIRN